MNILLGITGSIASYKSYDVARLLCKEGHRVKVILTQGALEFIRPETFRYLGVESVYLPQDDFNTSLLGEGETVLHVELAKWAQKLVVAPASANTLARLAMGITNDLLCSVFLAFPKKPILLFPAMNSEMWASSRIQHHHSSLKKISHLDIIHPTSGILACGDVGVGKFPEVQSVVDLIETYDPTIIKNKKILITAGATVSPLDPVRYLTNPSSGKMGISVGKAFLAAGYQVTILAGHQCSNEVENLQGHPHFKLIKTPTTEIMREVAVKNFPDSDLYISTGAIADIEFETASIKLKKESLRNALPFRPAADILKEILSLRTHQKIIGFAAETETTPEVFKEKMRRKPVDLLIGNKVTNGLVGESEILGFQKPDGEYFFIEENSIQGPIPLTKKILGEKLVQWYESNGTKDI